MVASCWTGLSRARPIATPTGEAAKRRSADTRMPVKILFDDLDTGATVDERLEWLPDIEPDQGAPLVALVRAFLAVPAQ